MVQFHCNRGRPCLALRHGHEVGPLGMDCLRLHLGGRDHAGYQHGVQGVASDDAAPLLGHAALGLYPSGIADHERRDLGHQGARMDSTKADREAGDSCHPRCV